MDFNPKVNKLIKRHYRETPVSGSEALRDKFSDILEVQNTFPTTGVRSRVVSNAITKESPMS